MTTPQTFKQPVRGERLSDQVAAQLQAMITDRSLRAGEKIPSERELCELLGVSRTVVREAVRSLVAKGLLEARAGGGTVVRAPDAALVTEMMGIMLAAGGREIGFDHLREVRLHLETEIADLAAGRRTASDLETMRAQLEAMQRFEHDPVQWAVADVAFHAAIAEATHNPLYPVLLGSISELLMEVRLTGIRLPGTPQRAFKHHQHILEAIERGDRSAARKAMLAHLRESQETFTRARIASGSAAMRRGKG
jgi:GntR family transcriptional repressor for pyruvate dehydrogenase complex